jgi:hypothetical protein
MPPFNSVRQSLKSECQVTKGERHDHKFHFNLPCMRRVFRPLLRCNLGILVCGRVAGSERTTRINGLKPHAPDNLQQPALSIDVSKTKSRAECGMSALPR